MEWILLFWIYYFHFYLSVHLISFSCFQYRGGRDGEREREERWGMRGSEEPSSLLHFSSSLPSLWIRRDECLFFLLSRLFSISSLPPVFLFPTEMIEDRIGMFPIFHVFLHQPAKFSSQIFRNFQAKFWNNNIIL